MINTKIIITDVREKLRKFLLSSTKFGLLKILSKSLQTRSFGIIKIMLSKISNPDSVGVIYI